MIEPLILSAILLLYSNLLGWIAARRRSVAAESPFKFANGLLLLLLTGAISATRWQSPRATLRQMGLLRAGLAKSLAAGAVVGAAIALPPLLFFAKPLLLDQPVEFGPVGRMSRNRLLRLVLVETALGVGLAEESFFRGLLQDSWGRAVSPRRAMALTSAVFAGWHFAVTLDTLTHTNVLQSARLPRPLRRHARLIALAGGLATTGAGGAIFSLIRQRSGNLWGAVLAHWLVDSLMLIALWRRGRSGSVSGKVD